MRVGGSIASEGRFVAKRFEWVDMDEYQVTLDVHCFH